MRRRALLVGMTGAIVTLLAVSPLLSWAQSGGARAPSGPAARTVDQPSLAVGLQVLHLVDPSRTIRLPGGRTEPRTLVTLVRYPAVGAAGQLDLPGAPAARAAGPFPLVVFGHGFAVTPAIYAHLLQSWAQAGYVVAAPVFPLGNAYAPGGPDESDLVNQPGDMSFVISSMIARSASPLGPLSGLVNPASIAVAGQSDGAETALAVAYSRRYRDPRVRAAVVLSGAMLSGIGGYDFQAGRPALLAVQGTADTLNEPRYTYAYFRRGRRPKYLLRLLGAEHLPPYTSQRPQLGIVERATTAFLDGYLKGVSGEVGRMLEVGNVPRASQLLAEP